MKMSTASKYVPLRRDSSSTLETNAEIPLSDSVAGKKMSATTEDGAQPKKTKNEVHYLKYECYIIVLLGQLQLEVH